MAAAHVDGSNGSGPTPGSDPPRSNGGRCPDADLLAGFVDGRLLAAERARVEAHVDHCASCRRLVADVARTVPPSPASAGRRRWSVRMRVAAALLIALAGTWIVRGATRAAPTERERLAEVLAALQEREARPNAGLQPLGDAELDAPRGAVLRGGITLRAPVGTVLEVRPAVRWDDVAGVGSWTVTLSTDELRVLWERTTADEGVGFPAEEPALEPGRGYIVRVVGEGAGGRVEVEQGFEVADAEQRAAFARRVAAIRALDGDVAWLAVAHAALADGLLAEAEGAARRHCAAHPDSRLGHRVLRQVLRRIGTREAEQVRIPDPPD